MGPHKGSLQLESSSGLLPLLTPPQLNAFLPRPIFFAVHFNYNGSLDHRIIYDFINVIRRLYRPLPLLHSPVSAPAPKLA
ncbi:hypothetical protein HO173_008344 [Letharia columbiana]|uniref:Uncharacterized protein n=1 Tax=Letharia columbiana TaxID=112416 RepID=A0A8H6FRL2_9LECA|nr:uncharacterized protein HO173_008344 [Letharia columbiana]KAF6233412.1 hypothetical protein HO173_008344 [Letharia columbiana]